MFETAYHFGLFTRYFTALSQILVFILEVNREV